MSDYAVLGDPQMCGFIRKALSKHNMSVLSDVELEVQDEWDARRWFSRNTPDGVFISVGMLGLTSVHNFSFTTGGTYNVIKAAMGNAKRLILISGFPTQEFFLFSRLVDLLYHEKQLDFYSLVRNSKEEAAAFAERCVLFMRDVSAKEAHEGRAQSTDQRREVCDQMVPQPEGSEQHGQAAQPVLEMPVASASGETPGDLRAERAPAAGQAPQGANHDNPDAV